ncbi:UNVERIFIED_CONTAM: hypothetical protein NCL1_35755 [Trichonephila clavipes]
MTDTRDNQVPLTDPVKKHHWKHKCIDLLKQVEKNSSTKEFKGKIDILHIEEESLEKKLKVIEQEIKDVTKQLKEKSTEKEDEPINSNILKLYELITKLTFAIKKPPTDLQGCILYFLKNYILKNIIDDVAGNSLETFHFDTTKQTKQFIIDHLWQLIYSELELEKNISVSSQTDVEKEEMDFTTDKYKLHDIIYRKAVNEQHYPPIRYSDY